MISTENTTLRFVVFRMMAASTAVEDLGKKATFGLPNCYETSPFFQRISES